jgi:hypothetical protein
MLDLAADPSTHREAIRKDNNKLQSEAQLATRGSGSMTATKKHASRHLQLSNSSQENTILSRNQAAGVEMDTLLWRALCDNPRSASKYLSKDAMIVNALLFGDVRPRSKDSEPTLKESLKDCEAYLTYNIHDSNVVEIDMMAVATMYSVTLFAQTKGSSDSDGKFTAVEATASCSWRQVAGGDWELTSMHVAYAE